MDGDQDLGSGEMVGDDEHVGADEGGRTVRPGDRVRLGDKVYFKLPAKGDRPGKIVYTSFSRHCSDWAWPFRRLTKSNKQGQSNWGCKDDEHCPFLAVLTMNEADSSFTAKFVRAHYDDCPKFKDPRFHQREAMRAAMSNYRTSAAGRAAAEADQARGDVAGDGGRDAAEMDVVEEAGEGASAAVAADQPPSVAGGGMVAEAEAMEGAGAAVAADQPPLWLEVV